MEGASTGHTPGEISSVWGSTTAADVVGGRGGDRDTLGGCAVGKEVGGGAREMHQGTESHHHQASAVPWGGNREGGCQGTAAITEDTEGQGVTTEDTGKEDIWVEVDGDGLGEGRRQGRPCMESSTSWREVAPCDPGRLEPQEDSVDQPSGTDSLWCCLSLGS